jgi:hypothetical protein
MGSQKEATELATLRNRWRKWTALIEKFARRHRTRCSADAEAYRKLHKEVLELCRSLAGRADETRRAFFESLEELAKPWLNPEVLERTDWEILLDVVARCDQAAGELGGRRYGPGGGRWGRGALVLGAILLGLAGLAWAADRLGGQLLDWVKARGQGVSFAIEAPYLVVAGIFGIPIAIYLVWYSARG